MGKSMKTKTDSLRRSIVLMNLARMDQGIKRRDKLPVSGMWEVTSLQIQQLLKGEWGDSKG